jgi:transposase InsO family protein
LTPVTFAFSLSRSGRGSGIDDHSRFCVAAALVGRATSKAVCEVFAASLRRFGIPDEVLTDNGKVFTARFGPYPTEVAFDRICRKNGISHRHTGVRSPTTTGKIERFHQSLRKEFLADRTLRAASSARPRTQVPHGKEQHPPLRIVVSGSGRS